MCNYILLWLFQKNYRIVIISYLHILQNPVQSVQVLDLLQSYCLFSLLQGWCSVHVLYFILTQLCQAACSQRYTHSLQIINFVGLYSFMIFSYDLLYPCSISCNVSLFTMIFFFIFHTFFTVTLDKNSLIFLMFLKERNFGAGIVFSNQDAFMIP